MPAYPRIMVDPAGVEVPAGTPHEANNLVCRGYRFKIESKTEAPAPTPVPAPRPAVEPVAEPVEGAATDPDRKPVRPVRPGSK